MEAVYLFTLVVLIGVTIYTSNRTGRLVAHVSNKYAKDVIENAEAYTLKHRELFLQIGGLREKVSHLEGCLAEQGHKFGFEEEKYLAQIVKLKEQVTYLTESNSELCKQGASMDAKHNELLNVYNEAVKCLKMIDYHLLVNGLEPSKKELQQFKEKYSLWSGAVPPEKGATRLQESYMKEHNPWLDTSVSPHD